MAFTAKVLKIRSIGMNTLPKHLHLNKATNLLTAFDIANTNNVQVPKLRFKAYTFLSNINFKSRTAPISVYKYSIPIGEINISQLPNSSIDAVFTPYTEASLRRAYRPERLRLDLDLPYLLERIFLNPKTAAIVHGYTTSACSLCKRKLKTEADYISCIHPKCIDLFGL